VLIAATTISLVLLFAAAVLCVLRLVRGSSIADRIVALDALLVITISTVAVLAVRGSTTVYLPVLVVSALIAFVGTLTVARYMDARGADS
jgi:multicomponent Na+:H+ antiporter subunit F